MAIGKSVGRFTGAAGGYYYGGKTGATVGGYLGEKLGGSVDYYVPRMLGYSHGSFSSKTPPRFGSAPGSNYKRVTLPSGKRRKMMEVDNTQRTPTRGGRKRIPATPKRHGRQLTFKNRVRSPYKPARRVMKKRSRKRIRGKSAKVKDTGLMKAFKGAMINKPVAKVEFKPHGKVNYAKTGATLYNTYGGVSTDQAGLFVGHGTSCDPNSGLMNSFAMCIFRKLLKKMQIDIDNWFDLCSIDLPLGTGTLAAYEITVEWLDQVTGARVATAKYSLDSTKTWIANALLLTPKLIALSSTTRALDTSEGEFLRITLGDNNAALPGAGPVRGEANRATLYMKDMHISYKMVSTFKFMNTTQSGETALPIADAPNNSVTDIRTHPLQMRAFQPAGWTNGIIYNQKSKTVSGTNKINMDWMVCNSYGMFNDSSSATTVIGTTQDTDKGFQTLVDGRSFTPHCATGDHVLDPGEEHKDSIVFECHLPIKKFLVKIWPSTFESTAATQKDPVPFGKVRMYQFKRNLTPFNTTAAAVPVSIDWQLQQWHSFSLVERKKNFLPVANISVNAPGVTQVVTEGDIDNN